MANEQITRPRLKKIPMIDRKSLMVGDIVYLQEQWHTDKMLKGVVSEVATDPDRFLIIVPADGVKEFRSFGWSSRTFNEVVFPTVNSLSDYVRVRANQGYTVHVRAMTEKMYEEYQTSLKLFKEYDTLRSQIRSRVLLRKRGQAASLEALEKALDILKTNVVL